MTCFLGMRARLDAGICWLKGHDVQWRANVDEVCEGDILCDTCDCMHWCRAMDNTLTRGEKLLTVLISAGICAVIFATIMVFAKVFQVLFL